MTEGSATEPWAGRVPVEKVDHVAIAVESIRSATRLFADVMGAEFVGGGDNPRLEVRAVQFGFPSGVKVELLQPLTATSYLRRYLDRTGEGFHHMTVYVDDVAESARALDGAGFETVDTSLERPTWQETFIRPSAAFGMLIQLAKTEIPWDRPLPGLTLDDVLAGKVQTLDNVCTWVATGEPINLR